MEIVTGNNQRARTTMMPAVDLGQQANQHYPEILQEVRVTQTAVQILLAALLSVTFAPRFALLDNLDLLLYVTSVVLSASAAGALIFPAAFHRMVFQRRLKSRLVRYADRAATLGLFLTLLALACTLLLVLGISVGYQAAIVIAVATGTFFSAFGSHFRW